MVPDEERVDSSRVIYISDFISHSEMQIHLINCAKLMIGGASGMTLMARLTNTPLLLIDIPFPIIQDPPTSARFKILLKRIFLGESNVSVTEYFRYSTNAYFKHSVQCPLLDDGFTLLPNSPSQIIGGICEVLELDEDLYLSNAKVQGAQNSYQSDYSNIRSKAISDLEAFNSEVCLPKYMSKYNWIYESYGF